MIFNVEITGWESWGRIFQNIPAFAPLAKEIFRREGLPDRPLSALTPGTNAVFRSEGVVIKIFAPRESGLNTTVDYAIELSAMDAAARQGVTTPKVLARGEVRDRYLFRYIVMEYIPGRDLSALKNMPLPQKTDIVRQIKEMVQRLSSEKLTNVEAVIPCAGVDDVQERRERMKGLPQRLIDELQGEALGSRVLCHGDMTQDNLMIDENERLVLLDFADSRLAPACYETLPLVFELLQADPELVRLYRDKETSAFVEELMDGFRIHPFAGNILKDFLKREQLGMTKVENAHRLRELLLKRFA